MARIGGRNSWIAVPAGVICAVVVGALVWLSLPMVPVTMAWIGETLRRATTPEPAPTGEPSPAMQAAEGGPIDCRTLYPDDLWNELTWQGGSLLGQTAAPPATQAASLVEAVAPEVLVTCDWSFASGGVVTTLSRVPADARPIAEAAFAGQGFSCTTSDAALVCVRTSGGVLEEHTLRDDLWLASIESPWHPEEYGARLERHVFG
ncbi:hypothetical protein K0817_015880 [Microbacterium sp. HD4P20]|uniref:hypothetical protein n=1 Tax=Microbacterium sp. HD4P20 TaxID=2864874 RepID=UPI001C63E1F9|nr:hypothetical protein [Microbacterium sp. HD4P20]MCP2638033.1 hypothetical protein [Microbacterium sp. HD4P20]